MRDALGGPGGVSASHGIAWLAERGKVAFDAGFTARRLGFLQPQRHRGQSQ